MPYRVNIAPRIFTKLVKAIVQQLRNRSLQVMVYLDDWPVWAAMKSECLQTAQEVMKFLQSLGFQNNLGKSSLSPAQEFQWLGLHWNLKSHTLSLPQGKRKEITNSVRCLLRSKVVTRWQQERVLGSLQFDAVTDPSTTS
ncbi:uncharacterized protein [Palaemon carinicauda]|uniref:uncharacterized protein n=1 Tax=Palaemon carinicauda TaxID=392227 RepID=UPI0035B689A5